MIRKYFMMCMLLAILLSSCAPAFKEAQTFFDEKKYDDALSVCRLIIRDDPGHFEAHELMAKIYEMQNNFPNALYHYKKCVEINPGDLGASLSLGNLLIKTEKYTDGVAVLENIREKIQQDKVALNNLGRGYLYTGKFTESRKILQQVLAMAPDYPEVHQSLGILAYKMREYPEAKKWLDEANKLDNESAETHFWLARTFGRLGNNEEMETEFRRALLFNPQLEEAYIHLGQYLMDEGNFGDAAEVFSDLLYYIEDSTEGKKYLDQVQKKLNWPEYRRNKGRTSGFGKSISPPCRIKWESWIGNNLMYAPITIGSTIFVIDSDRIAAMQPRTGKQLWVRPMDSRIVTEPIVVVPHLYACEEGKLTAVETKHGSIMWEYPADGTIATTPVFYKENVLLVKNIRKQGAGGIVLDIIDAAKGTLVSTFPLLDDPSSTCVSAAVEEDYLYTVFTGGDGAVIKAIDLYNGEVSWQQTVPGCIGDPCYSDIAMFLATTPDTIMAFDLNGGTRLWTQKSGGKINSNIIWHDYKLYVVLMNDGGKNTLLSIQDDSGNVEWQLEQSAGKMKNGQQYISLSEDRLLWLTGAGAAMIVDTSGGKQVWNYLSPSPSISVASMLDRRFYMNTKDGFVYAFEHGEPVSEQKQRQAASSIKDKIHEGKQELAKDIKGRLLAFSLQMRMIVNEYGDWTGGFDIEIKNDNSFPLTNVKVALDGKYMFSASKDAQGKSLQFIDLGGVFVVNTLQFVSSSGEKYPDQGKPATIKIFSDQGQGFTKISW